MMMINQSFCLFDNFFTIIPPVIFLLLLYVKLGRELVLLIILSYVISLKIHLTFGINQSTLLATINVL